MAEHYGHQIEALSKSEGRASFAYLMEMGTGKSRVLIHDACRAFRAGDIDRVIVFANKGSYSNWDRELDIHMPADVDWVSHLWRGMHSAKEKSAFAQLGRSSYMKWFIVNIETLSAGNRALDICEKYIRGGKTFLCVDESTTVKNPDSSRSKSILYLRKYAHIRRIMTGLVAPHSPLDVYAQFEVLQKGILGFTSFYAFRNHYAILEDTYGPGGRSFKTVAGYINQNQLAEKIGQHSFRVMKEHCLDIPEKVYERIQVELTHEQLQAYSDMVRAATTKLDTGEHVTATTALAMQTRLHQILCGHTRTEEGLLVTIPSKRVPALLSCLEEVSGSALIWCAYREDITQVVAALVKEFGAGSVVEYHGGVPQADRDRAIEKFQSGQARFFVGTPASGGKGITLTKATCVIYFSNGHDLEHRLQSEDRAHRAGQRNVVTYIDLVVPGTVDEKRLYAHRNKLDMASLIQRDGWRKWAI